MTFVFYNTCFSLNYFYNFKQNHFSKGPGACVALAPRCIELEGIWRLVLMRAPTDPRENTRPPLSDVKRHLDLTSAWAKLLIIRLNYNSEDFAFRLIH